MPSQPALSTDAEEPLGKMNKTKPRKLGPTRLLTRKAFGQVKEETNTESVLHRAAVFTPRSKFSPPETSATPIPPTPRHGSVYKTLTNACGKASVRAGTCNPQ